MAGSFSQAQKRYKRAFIPVMVFYVVACFGGSYLRAQYETPPDWLSAIVALTMAAPVVAVLFLKLRLLSETDEYTRFRQARNMLFGAAFTVSVCTVSDSWPGCMASVTCLGLTRSFMLENTKLY